MSAPWTQPVIWNGTDTGFIDPSNGGPISGSATLISNIGTLVTNAATATSFYKIALNSKVGFPDPLGAADTVNSQIVVPSWANFVKVTGHCSFPDQNVGSGHASIHLFRNVGATPIYTPSAQAVIAGGGSFQAFGVNTDSPTPEAHYHNRVYYPQLATNYFISVIAMSGWIPVMALNESWTLYAWQNSGGNVTTSAGVEAWLTVDFTKFII